jgi:DnaJ-class molecular chaperone
MSEDIPSDTSNTVEGKILTDDDNENWMDRVRVMTCPECNGDGGGEIVTGHDPQGPITQWQRCGHCDGKGQIEQEVEPITLEDLDQ